MWPTTLYWELGRAMSWCGECKIFRRSLPLSTQFEDSLCLGQSKALCILCLLDPCNENGEIHAVSLDHSKVP